MKLTKKQLCNMAKECGLTVTNKPHSYIIIGKTRKNRTVKVKIYENYIERLWRS